MSPATDSSSRAEAVGPGSTVRHARRRDLRRQFVRHLLRNGAIFSTLVLLALLLGAAGYHFLDGLPWLDSLLNAAMILTGMGPVSPISTSAAKLFAAFYALFSGVFFLTMIAVLLAPVLRHFLHRFHLDLDQQVNQGTGERD